jgi:hypothetical protein
MGKKSTPAAPDYTKLAEMTAASQNAQIDKQTAANRVNQYTPEGSLTWAQGPGGTWSQTTTLSPEAQQAHDAQQRIGQYKSDLAETLLPRMADEYGQAPDWSSLSPYAKVPLPMQQLSATTSASGGIPQAGPLRDQYDFSKLQAVQGSDASRQRAEDAFYKSATSRLDPQWQQQQAQMESQLANQGITRGSAAFEKAMDQMARQRTDAYSQAQLASITNAGAEAQRNQGMDLALRGEQVGEAMNQGNLYNQTQGQRYTQGMQGAQLGLQQQQQAFGQRQAAGQQNFGQALQNATFQNQQRQQQLTEMMQQRGFSLNEINAILNGVQVGMPSFAGYNTAGAGSGVDYSGAGKDQYSASMDAYNAAQAASPLNAAASLAGTAMKAYTGGMSDARIKRDIKRIGRHPRGYGIFTYRFVGERGQRTGVIAQDVLKHAPELVTDLRGVLMVRDEALEGI